MGPVKYILGIGISVYNKEADVGVLLRNLAEQQDERVKIYVTDDSSTDRSWSEILRYQTHFSISKNNKNLGAGLTKNMLLSAISTECQFAALIDGDDNVVEDYVKVLLRELSGPISFDVLAFGTIVRNGTSDTLRLPAVRSRQLKPADYALLQHKSSNLNFTAVDKIYRTDKLLPELSFGDEFYDDHNFSVRLLQIDLTFATLDQCLYIYQQDAFGRLTSNVDIQNLNDLKAEIDDFVRCTSPTRVNNIILWKLLTHYVSIARLLRTKNPPVPNARRRFFSLISLSLLQERGFRKLVWITILLFAKWKF